MFLPSNVSTNKLSSPTNVEGAEEGLLITVPTTTGTPEDYQKVFALVTSLILCNKSGASLSISAKIINGSTSASLLNGLLLKVNTSYDVINGNKVTLKEGDSLYVWHDNASSNVLDVVMSYTLHRPLTTYSV